MEEVKTAELGTDLGRGGPDRGAGAPRPAASSDLVGRSGARRPDRGAPQPTALLGRGVFLPTWRATTNVCGRNWARSAPPGSPVARAEGVTSPCRLRSSTVRSTLRPERSCTAISVVASSFPEASLTDLNVADRPRPGARQGRCPRPAAANQFLRLWIRDGDGHKKRPGAVATGGAKVSAHREPGGLGEPRVRRPARRCRRRSGAPAASAGTSMTAGGRARGAGGNRDTTGLQLLGDRNGQSQHASVVDPPRGGSRRDPRRGTAGG